MSRGTGPKAVEGSFLWEFRRVRPLLAQHKNAIIIALVAGSVFAISQLSLPVIVKYLIDVVVTERPELLIWMLVLIGAILVVRWIAQSVRI